MNPQLNTVPTYIYLSWAVTCDNWYISELWTVTCDKSENQMLLVRRTLTTYIWSGNYCNPVPCFVCGSTLSGHLHQRSPIDVSLHIHLNIYIHKLLQSCAALCVRRTKTLSSGQHLRHQRPSLPQLTWQHRGMRAFHYNSFSKKLFNWQFFRRIKKKHCCGSFMLGWFYLCRGVVKNTPSI